MTTGLNEDLSDYLATKFILINEEAISTYLVIDEQAEVNKIIEEIFSVERIKKKEADLPYDED
ncbi:hypothetical protein GCM10007968_30360 [Sporolactobacillus putidus]|uniref:Uncharacterized protein n=2 Tax=Sporolactobacillus putidus TaxID=492735 RepID=A0A917W5B1_9BACL|nr:hypothetical protein GCM10007968_30360 [Sporolactobacillus putidus]